MSEKIAIQIHWLFSHFWLFCCTCWIVSSLYIWYIKAYIHIYTFQTSPVLWAVFYNVLTISLNARSMYRGKICVSLNEECNKSFKPKQRHLSQEWSLRQNGSLSSALRFSSKAEVPPKRNWTVSHCQLKMFICILKSVFPNVDYQCNGKNYENNENCHSQPSFSKRQNLCTTSLREKGVFIWFMQLCNRVYSPLITGIVQQKVWLKAKTEDWFRSP